LLIVVASRIGAGIAPPSRGAFPHDVDARTGRRLSRAGRPRGRAGRRKRVLRAARFRHWLARDIEGGSLFENVSGRRDRSDHLHRSIIAF